MMQSISTPRNPDQMVAYLVCALDAIERYRTRAAGRDALSDLRLLDELHIIADEPRETAVIDLTPAAVETVMSDVLAHGASAHLDRTGDAAAAFHDATLRICTDLGLAVDESQG